MSRTEPDHETTAWPPGIKYIIGNEGCERFSFYGMKSILWTYLAFMYCQQMVSERTGELCDAVATKGGMEGLSAVDAALLAPVESQATATIHMWIAGVYALPMIGAIVADRLLGKYRTIIWLSLVYCAGHAVLSLFETSFTGIYVGLALIAIGSGGIKPCVSAHVGDQFGRGNWFRIGKVFQAFYFIINFGSFFSTLLIPVIKEQYGWSVAFAIPGVLMFIATIFFWMGRKSFVHVPGKPGGILGLLDALSASVLFMSFGHLFVSAGMSTWIQVCLSIACLIVGFSLFFWRQRISADDGFLAIMVYSLKVLFIGGEDEQLPKAAEEDPEEDDDYQKELRASGFFSAATRRFGVKATEGPVAVLKIMSIFFLVSVFWALFDQHGSTWIAQAGKMNRDVVLPIFGEMTLLKEQIGSTNPIMVMILIPITSSFLYPLITKLGFNMTPLRRMTIGMLIAGSAFVAVAIFQGWIDAGETPHIYWHLVPYGLITLAEVMVSVTGLEFAYTQAPARMKSTIMGFWLLTVALGNVLVVFLSGLENLSRQDFFWTCAGLMAGAAVLFGLRAAFYKYRDYTQ